MLLAKGVVLEGIDKAKIQAEDPQELLALVMAIRYAHRWRAMGMCTADSHWMEGHVLWACRRWSRAQPGRGPEVHWTQGG